MELADPDAADELYESCTHFLRERTRDKGTFPLVFAENVSYGFRRNLLGLRPVGITTSLVGLVIGAFASGATGYRTPYFVVAPLSAVVSGGLLLFWIARVNSGWVKQAADAYADRLLGACDTLFQKEKAGV
jgi:hypothetical protein